MGVIITIVGDGITPGIYQVRPSVLETSNLNVYPPDLFRHMSSLIPPW